MEKAKEAITEVKVASAEVAATAGAGTLPPVVHDNRPRNVAMATIVAIVVIAAMLSLLAWAAPFERSGVGAEAANPNAGQFVPLDRDDPWNLHRLASNW
jgi:hypothetical protein